MMDLKDLVDFELTSQPLTCFGQSLFSATAIITHFSNHIYSVYYVYVFV